jgi:hypothetical protein
MQRILFAVALGVGLVGLATPSHASALTGEKIDVKVPFAFQVGGIDLPAGRYVVQQADIHAPELLTLESRDTGRTVLLLTDSGYADQPVRKAHMVFDRYGNQRFLRALWLPNEQGLVFSMSPAEIRAARAAGPETTGGATTGTSR